MSALISAPIVGSTFAVLVAPLLVASEDCGRSARLLIVLEVDGGGVIGLWPLVRGGGTCGDRSRGPVEGSEDAGGAEPGEGRGPRTPGPAPYGSAL